MDSEEAFGGELPAAEVEADSEMSTQMITKSSDDEYSFDGDEHEDDVPTLALLLRDLS